MENEVKVFPGVSKFTEEKLTSMGWEKLEAHVADIEIFAKGSQRLFRDSKDGTVIGVYNSTVK